MKKITVSILTTLLMLSMVFSSSVFAAEKEQSAWDSFLGLFSAKTAATSDVGVEYRGHIQNVGNYPLDGSWIQGPTELGTEGKGLRLEGFWIQLDGDVPADAHIEYQVHVQNVGWMDPVQDGEFAGTEGRSLQIEAIKISLVDDEGVQLEDYSVVYSGHVQNVGDVGPFTNGEQLGTVGSFLRLEAIEVEIVQNPADLTEYNAALAAVTQADYTAASWTTYQAVVNANKMTEDNLQSEVDAATANITAAQANLVKVLKVESVSAMNAQQILVTFTQIVSKADAETTSNYILNAANSSAAGNLTITTAKLQDDKKSVILTLGSPYLNNKTAASYLCNIKNVTDIAGVKTVEYSQTLNLFDAVAPTVTGITYPDSNTIKVAFSEPVNTISTGIASATTIKLDGTTVVIPSSAYTLATDKQSFTINIATAGLLSSKNYVMTIEGLTDFASNTLVKFTGDITFAPDTTNPTVTGLTAIDLSHFKVTFSEPIKNLSPYFAVKIDGSTAGGTISNANTTTPDYKTFIFNMTTPTTTGNHIVTVNNFQDTAGNPTNVALSTYSQELAFAVTKPAMTSTVGTVKTIGGTSYVVFSFDRDVVAGTGTISGSYVKDSVTYPWSTTTIKDSTTLSIEKNEIAIPAPASVGNYTGSFPAASVKDTYNNTNAKTDVTFVIGSTTPATVSSVAQGSTSATMDYVTVGLSKDVSNAALDYTKYTVDGVQVFNAATFDGNRSTVKLTLKSGAITTTGNKTVVISGISDITDKTYDGTTYPKIAFVENVKPVIQKVELVSLSNIRITFSENVANAAANQFEVKVNGTVASTTLVGANNNVVTLGLTTPLTTSTTPVTVSVISGTVITDTATPGNLTPEGQLTTATVALTDTKGLADAALTSAFAQFVSNNAGTIDGTLASGKTAATARTAYNAAVTAVNNHGDTTAQLSINSLTPTYAQCLAWLKAAVLMAEAEDFAATADLTASANYTTLYTDMATATNAAVTAMPADGALGTNDTAKVDIGARATALFTTEKAKIDTAKTNYAALVTAIDTVVATSGNTSTNLAAAETAYDNAVTANTALTSLSAASKAKLIADTSAQKARVASVVTNIKLVQGASTNLVKATWGSDNGNLTLTEVTLGTVTYTTGAGITAITVNNTTGAFSITGTATSTVTVGIPGTSALNLFDTATVTSGAASIASGGAVIVVAP